MIAAYRRMVQMYHPDKVSGLAPEYAEIAERKMKEINAAYAQLKPKR
jgi:DnaJ-domain-containing protein 1